MRATTNEVHLHLTDIKNFFQVPDIDPFEGDDLGLSGIDQLMDALKAQPDWKGRNLHTIVHLLPEDQGDPRLLNMPKYLQRYCDKQIQHSRRKIKELGLEGRHALRMGTAFLVLCLGLSALTRKLLGADMLLVQVLVEGFVIAGWVGLWHPLELLLYAWWPHAQDVRLYEKLKSMQLDYVFDNTLNNTLG